MESGNRTNSEIEKPDSRAISYPVIALTCCVWLAIQLSVSAAGRSQTASGPDLQKMEAVAARCVGVDQSTSGHLKSIDLVPFFANDLPEALSAYIQLERILKVVYDSVRIWKSDIRMHSVVALINPGNGNVLQVTAVRTDSSAEATGRTALDSEVERLLNRRFCYAGIPDSQYTSFVSMIRNCPMNAPTARRITAVYAMDSCTKSGKSEPRWFVALAGTRPYPMHGWPGVPDSLLNQGPTDFWVLMDGRTGAPIRSGNM